MLALGLEEWRKAASGACFVAKYVMATSDTRFVVRGDGDEQRKAASSARPVARDVMGRGRGRRRAQPDLGRYMIWRGAVEDG